ncbi:MAG TPA: family 10 glycosylhydrolase [Longimicrobiales bacterium]|nr:family 10 glycosylhydrolase [Longimicrobiales bacterium]
MKARAVVLSVLAASWACTMVAVRPEEPVPPGGTGRVARADTALAPEGDRKRVGAEAGPTRRFKEVRGVWVVRGTLTGQERVRRMVADVDQAGFNTLLVQVRGRGDAFYASRWEPRGETVEEPGFDPLALTLVEAHRRGIAVHAWVNTHLVWSGPRLPASPEHLVNEHPDWLGVPRALARELWSVDPHDPRFVGALRRYAADNPETVEGIYTSPSHPGVQERLYDVWMDLAERYELDGIHFDYVRFPSGDFDYSRGALDRFRSWVAPRLSPERLRELDRAYRGDPFAFTDALPGPWGEFRRAQITRLVERIHTGVKARRPDLVVSAAVFANVDDAYSARFQDWRAWLDQGIVDVVVPMAYTPQNGLFAVQIREAAVSAGRRDRVWAGIGAYQNGLAGTLDKIDLARREGVGGLVLFSYDWAAGEGSEGAPGFLQRVGSARFGGR